MTHDEILKELERLQPWFHRIDLGDGLFTKTASVMGEPVDHPRESWEVISQCLPNDLTGKSLLDVGCNGGFYCVEAKRRGAERVLGVDGQRQHVRQALFVRQMLGLELEFRRLSVYDLDPTAIGRFDITLALGLVYHLKHLVFALERLFAVTNEMLIVETAVIPPEKTPASFVQALGAFEQMLHPLFYAENSADAKEQVFNWFLPSPGAIRALLLNTGFESVEIFSVIRDRAVLVCRKGGKPRDLGASGFAAHLSLDQGEGTRASQPGEQIELRIRATNAGVSTWPAGDSSRPAKGQVQLGAHLLRANEDEVAWDYGRAPLPHTVAPGGSAQILISLGAPAEGGDYIIELDMVAEELAWFEDAGGGTLRVALRVR